MLLRLFVSDAVAVGHFDCWRCLFECNDLFLIFFLQFFFCLILPNFVIFLVFIAFLCVCFFFVWIKGKKREKKAKTRVENNCDHLILLYIYVVVVVVVVIIIVFVVANNI